MRSRFLLGILLLRSLVCLFLWKQTDHPLRRMMVTPKYQNKDTDVLPVGGTPLVAEANRGAGLRLVPLS